MLLLGKTQKKHPGTSHPWYQTYPPPQTTKLQLVKQTCHNWITNYVTGSITTGIANHSLTLVVVMLKAQQWLLHVAVNENASTLTLKTFSNNVTTAHFSF